MGDVSFEALLLSDRREPDAKAFNERPCFLPVIELDEVGTLEFGDCLDFARLHP